MPSRPLTFSTSIRFVCNGNVMRAHWHIKWYKCGPYLEAEPTTIQVCRSHLNFIIEPFGSLCDFLLCFMAICQLNIYAIPSPPSSCVLSFALSLALYICLSACFRWEFIQGSPIIWLDPSSGSPTFLMDGCSQFCSKFLVYQNVNHFVLLLSSSSSSLFFLVVLIYQRFEPATGSIELWQWN